MLKGPRTRHSQALCILQSPPPGHLTSHPHPTPPHLTSPPNPTRPPSPTLPCMTPHSQSTPPIPYLALPHPVTPSAAAHLFHKNTRPSLYLRPPHNLSPALHTQTLRPILIHSLPIHKPIYILFFSLVSIHSSTLFYRVCWPSKTLVPKLPSFPNHTSCVSLSHQPVYPPTYPHTVQFSFLSTGYLLLSLFS